MHLLVGGPYVAANGEEHRYGHTALRLKTSKFDLTYDFGRYGKTSGMFGESGEGISRVWNRVSKVEMKFRANKSDKEKKFHRAEVVYASNASDVIWFTVKNFVYQTHLPARGGPLLEVLQNGETISHQSCSRGWANVRGDVDSANSYYTNHGTGSVDVMERLWNEK